MKKIAFIRFFILGYMPLKLMVFSNFKPLLSLQNHEKIGETIGEVLGILILILVLLYHALQGIKELKNENFSSKGLRILSILWGFFLIIVVVTGILQVFKFGITSDLLFSILFVTGLSITILTDIRLVKNKF